LTVIPIGPYHPALKEGEYFKLEVEGERIIDADLKIGYNHRGVEWLAARRTFSQNVFLFERICGICSDAHSTCYCQTVEDLLGVEAPERARYLRTLMAELERLHSHFLWFGVAMHEMGFDTAFMHMWKDREIVMSLIEAIAGKRVNYGFNTIGGVRRDLPPKLARTFQGKILEVRRAADRIKEAVTRDRLIRARASGVGILPREDAMKMCVVGPTARASGIDIDVRRDDPYAAYEEIDWEVPLADGGDVLSRVIVRLQELYESISIVQQVSSRLSQIQGPLKAEVEEPRVGEAFGRVEAPRGELFYYIRSNGTNVPERVKVRTPSFMNNAALRLMLRGASIADAPLIIASIDPCYSCTDRVEVIDLRTGKVRRGGLKDISKGK
jgi:membrane-bound hydrogenase subunit alpha